MPYPLGSEGDFCGQVNQPARYVHSCLQPATLIKMSTNNHSRMSVVLESSVKPRQFSSPGLVWQKFQEPLIQSARGYTTEPGIIVLHMSGYKPLTKIYLTVVP